MNLTKKQAAILAYIREHIRDCGFAPSIEEMAAEFGVAVGTIHEHVKGLEAKGAIKSERHRARSIEVIEPARWPVLPICGRIAAGIPIEAVTDTRHFDFESVFPLRKECYMLEVKGQSMIEDHIQDGDFVVIESRSSARPGETVVALIDEEEATLKVFWPEGRKVRLEPANAAMKPIIVDTDKVHIQGVVVGVVRRY